MPRVPHELIREVQICTRAAAGLLDYDPSDPSLPSLPPLSAAIAAADSSAPNLRCKNCKGMLLRGTDSIICLYCGLGPHYDAVPEDICFTSSIGYQWLLRSLRLDGSEMVDLSEKSERNVSQSSPKSSTHLSEFLNFKITWPVETEKQETNSYKHSEESKRSLNLSGVAPDTFFLKSNKNAISDMPIEQPSDHQTEVAAKKDVAALDNQDLFRNVQSSEPAFSSSENKTSEALSGWEADFQSADSETEHVHYRSSEHVTGSTADSGIKLPEPESLQSSSKDSGVKFQDSESFKDSSADFGMEFQDPESFPSSSADLGIKFHEPEPFHSSSGPEVDLSAHFDSVFGPVANLKNEKPKEGQAVSPAFDEWNSNDTWNNLSSSGPNFSGGFDANFSSSYEPRNDSTVGKSMDNFTNDDLFQDFQFQTNYTDMTKNEITNEEHRTMDEDLFEDWDDFTGSTSLQVPSQTTYDEKSSERDLFSFDDNFEGDFNGFPQADLFSPSAGNSKAPTEEVNSIMSENPASVLTDEDAFGGSTKDDVKTLISQMHDLSFMLETDLSIPSGSDTANSSIKD